MKHFVQFQVLAFLLIFVGTALPFDKVADGVLVQLEGAKASSPRLIKIQVIAENIFRVIASPTEQFSTHPSLIVEKTEWPAVPFTVEEQGKTIRLSTEKLTAKINAQTGEISFFDRNGKPILVEQKGGGKIITPADVMGEETQHIQQICQSDDDEAFYGLGQHQYDWMNYKGKDVDLYQVNIISVVPFLVSNKNYGILWDNNSRTKFGDYEDYQPLSDFILYGKNQEPGLTAEYFKDDHFSEPLVTQSETVVAHANLEEWDNYPAGFNKNKGSIRWNGEIVCRQSGVYNFRFYSSNYAKLWLNNKLEVDCWRVNWMPWAHIVSLKMKAGERYPIKIEWIPNAGYIGLTAKGPEKELYQKSLSLYSEVADQIDYYFIHGKNLDDVISGYRQVTGKAPMMPKWAMGFWQCRQRYQTQDELIGIVQEFRKRRIPLDNIVQDWFYWPEDKWGDHDFDPQRFPDPAGMVKKLHDDLHAHIMISVWPKFYVGTKNYEQFKKKGWLYMRNVEKQERDWVGRGYVSTFYDPYSAGARELFWKQINEKLFSKGFDAWWLDATEPDLHSNLEHYEWRKRIGPTALGSASRYFNTYSLMNAKGIYEGQRQVAPNQRVFILTRSAYAGQQRYAAATWSGDIAARWYDMKAQIPAGLNFALSGIPYWTMDVGGFSTEARYQNAKGDDLDEWREQLTRWFQFGAFCPLFRVHGEFPYREMYLVAPEDHPAFKAMLSYDQLRYRLMPYIYSLTGMVTQNDYTIMRALVMDFGNDNKVFNIGDQFMFGPALMVNPVTTFKARSRQVYLPKCAGWYHLRTGKFFTGGQTIEADAPYSDIPLFVKAGAIVPTGPALQYSDEKPADPLRLYVYAGADGEFTLYEDDGRSCDYEKGAFATIPLRYDDQKKTLTIGDRAGEFDGMLQTRTIEVVFITREKPVGMDFTAPAQKSVKYDGTQQTILLD
jgi:alpha-D-xyloside xylohydrolase